MTPKSAYIYLTDKKIWISLSDKDDKKEAFEVEWEGKELDITLQEIRKELGITSLKAIVPSEKLKIELESACESSEIKIVSIKKPGEVSDSNPLYSLLNTEKETEIEKEEDAGVYISTESPKRKINKKTIIIISLILVSLSLLIFGGIWVAQSALNKEKQPEVTPTPAPTSTPTPTPEEVNPKDYSIQIQNGSGTPGEAGKVQILLESKGFEDIKTANADTYDYKETIVQMKDAVPGKVYELIDEAVNDKYKTKQESLSADSEYDIIVIVGEKI